jgi:hypothetical protein
VAYTYSGGAYRKLPLIDGYTDTFAVAINQRGTVLGEAGPRQEPAVTVVWRPAAAPLVIPDTVAGQTAVDIDDDGTILFNTDEGPYLLRAGTMSKLPVPADHEATRSAAVSSWARSTGSERKTPGRTGGRRPPTGAYRWGLGLRHQRQPSRGRGIS